jgi:hypothetical protein
LPKSSYDSLKAQLPSREDALSLIGYFYQLYAYNYDICREEQLMTYLAAFYPARPSQYSAKPWTNESHPHKLALIFITLAMGAMSNIDVEPPDMKTAAKYYQAAAACLNVVNFMHENTMACLQTLVRDRLEHAVLRAAHHGQLSFVGRRGNNADAQI